ncbi:MAG TPA: cupin domain-containing protein [Jiangellaceae bacterium]|nr:cupin domain-containing protein [Jiangellaceae bacterium]
MIHVDMAEAARTNDAFRRVLHTTGHVQLVVMTLQPGEDIGAEVHEHNDQVLTFVEGSVRAEVAGETSAVSPGDVVVVPAGTRHNFTNTGAGPARLYTLYSPPDHSPDTVHQTKADAAAAEREHTDIPPPEHD